MSRMRGWILGGTLIATMGISLLVGPGMAGAGGGVGTRSSGGTEATAAGDLNLQRTWVELFNARKWDELGGIYEEDAVLLPPNHEPVRGRAAITEFLRSMRDQVGEVACGEPDRITASGDLVAAVSSTCSAYSGTLRANTHELYARQSDGSLRYRFDMFGFQ
jgi:ketosteroid isomerase-like protein